MADIKTHRQKFHIGLELDGTTGVKGSATGYTVYGEINLRVAPQSVGGTNVIDIEGRLETEGSFVVIASITGTTADNVDISSFDYIRFNVTTADSTGEVIASGFFNKGLGATTGFTFSTIQVDAGTNPVADTLTDTLTLTSSDASVTITGNSATDTIDFTATSSGNVNGPAVAVDNTIARYDTTTGKLLQASGVSISDTDTLNVPGDITVTGTVDGIDIATDVAANTAKVSADGVVTTHSDVSSAGSGIIISAAERTAIGTNTTHVGTGTGNPHAVTATEVGLGNVDNTTDLGKPISTLTQAALDLKAPITELIQLSVADDLQSSDGLISQAIEWDSSVSSLKDTEFTHDTATNPSEITVTTGGRYRVSVQVGTRGTETNYRLQNELKIRTNDTTDVFTVIDGYVRASTGAFNANLNFVSIVELSASDVIEIYIRRVSTTTGDGVIIGAHTQIIVEKI